MTCHFCTPPYERANGVHANQPCGVEGCECWCNKSKASMSDEIQDADLDDVARAEHREAELKYVYSHDAPDGQGWFCPSPNCGHWSSLGGNAGYHATKREHGIPTLKPIPDDVETLSRPAKPKIAPGDTVLFHFVRLGAESKLEHRTRPAVVTSLYRDNEGLVANLYVYFEPWDSVGKWPMVPEFVERVRLLDKNDSFEGAPLMQRWSPRPKP